MKLENSPYPDLKTVKELVYAASGFDPMNLAWNKESLEYEACSFELNGRRVEYRTSKITPTKNGQFVTIWKRDKDGITQPFDYSDEIDFIVITSKSGDQIGQFIFPRTVLAEKGIISRYGKGGKRGIRVYPPWDCPTSKQAGQTQNWQTNYFISIQPGDETNTERIRKLVNL